MSLGKLQTLGLILADLSHIRIIGDVHGHIAPRPKRKERNVRDISPRSPRHARGLRRRNYLDLAAGSRFSIQIGDLGLDYTPLVDLDANAHRVIAGNHDNLSALSPHFLGDYGQHSIPLASGSFDFFYIRGARSLDIENRTEGVNWWANEELDAAQAIAATASYSEDLPGIVISHDCPTEIVDQVATISIDADPSRTSELLQDCFDCHAPRIWIFGHYHQNWVYNHPRGTTFICVGELCYYEYDELGNPVFDSPR